jgi:transmembrane sensor
MLNSLSFMTQFVNYSVSDFVLDEQFQQWVLAPTAESDSFWQNFMEQNPHKKTEIAKAKVVILQMKEDDDEPSVSQMNKVWEQVLSKTIKEDESLLLEENVVELPQKSSFKWFKIAASVGLLIGFIAGVYFYLNQTDKNRYEVAYGESRNVELPDGSVVKLNANSSLRISESWSSENSREVWLEGEAFFTVTKKPNQGNAKFIVHTQHLDVEVLGTEFNVSQRDTNTNVTLNSGKIKLAVHTDNGTDTYLMNPGEQISYSVNSLKIQKKDVKPENISAWVNNRWMLESTSLNEVAYKIENTFGLNVVIKDSLLAQERMTGVIMTNNLDEVLEGISTIYSLKVRRENNQLIIDK